MAEQLRFEWPETPNDEWRAKMRRMGRASGRFEELKMYWLRFVNPLPDLWWLGRLANCYSWARVTGSINRAVRLGQEAQLRGEAVTTATIMQFCESELRRETAERKLKKCKQERAQVLIHKQPGSVRAAARSVATSKLAVMPHIGRIQ